ncbi:peptidase domain-containing ABC transporter [Mucilaginibacter sp. Bleaf8]|uniref:peptidase domain-containing ABC transporter n=1 Tax=Mucilaginibacter sp. Bleaf8 TaxID=2834430 RepID=UPI001BD15A4B|nr:peptidase domain-containing ABC transporter [Mucilaginibacter sp. Bleaf8]MBS7566946.1 peptidase domain-containing ABC transporter [Mucilaginibacter sp. Bleaf8]
MVFPFFKQPDQMDCGPTCLRMVAKYYGRNLRLQTLRDICEVNRDGVSLLGISDGAEKIGFRSLGTKLKLPNLKSMKLPCILHWRQNHFVVLHKIRKNNYYIADPENGLIKLNEAEFVNSWISDKELNEGIALILNPAPQFYEREDDKADGISWLFLLRYIAAYRQMVMQLFLGLTIGTLLQLIVPFLTQSVVDIGINTSNLHYIYVVTIAQAILIIGRVSVEFIRSWILLHISTRLNISILTDFLIKLMKLPLSFFDTKMTGDIMQRMNDQQRIESFLTGSSLNTLFSFFNLFIFSVVLASYSTMIFFIYIMSSFLYVGWIFIFLKSRRNLNYKNFDISSKNQSNVVQLVSGMQEIKLNNCEQQKRWEWEHLQARLFRFNVKSLALSQYQQGGSTFINESTNLVITFISAKTVIDGGFTLGAMIAIQYIIGQLNNPVQQFLAFIQAFQDAKISLERMNEIHQMQDEEPVDKQFNHVLPKDLSVTFNDVTFRYPGAGNEPVLQNIYLNIPEGKTTAIVGMSGSGKTTLLKLLLRFYETEKGEIRVGDQLLTNIGFKTWRRECGVVMQDGFIFSDSIERNIAVGDERPDNDRLQHAIKVANIQDLIDSLPLGVKTRIGAEGNGISQGQRQRLLIARAVYKNPSYIFFDEATNSLDANNERVIMENMNSFFKGRTVIIVAHRLSTVNNADNIIVLDKGRIIEQGTHQQLVDGKGEYFNLVRNQLELGM